ncbi:ribonucleoside-diphosphate reductase [Salarchaeum japonicum]|uniref:ribonucleoside-diphosphate reductase n=1 Tax=Salarchaeum japonicum TaxID=555573 RepID=UPI003C75DAFF
MTDEPGMLDQTAQTYRYYRHAVENHWDPHEIALDTDADAVAELDDEMFTNLRGSLAAFGAGEESVTEDLAPLAVVLDDIGDELFVTTQLYEEAKHADFFDRYWRTVVAPEEERRGMTPTSPTDDRWFSEAYVELFDRMADAMDQLLVDDTPETRASAYCHYHLTIEGILAQTGYYGLTNAYGGNNDLAVDLPELPGLVAGLTRIRGDEGRHVGFGMYQLKDAVMAGDVDPAFIRDTVDELLPLVQESVVPDAGGGGAIADDPLGLVEYAVDKHTQRMQQITNASEDIPDVDTLTALE